MCCNIQLCMYMDNQKRNEYSVGIARRERSFFPENNNHQGKKLNFDFFFCGLDFNPHCASVRFFQSSTMN